jgi:diaminopimelate decarboxylase
MAENNFKTPALVFDTQSIINNAKKYRGKNNFKTLYSVKLCPDSRAVNIINRYVDGYDIANYNEFKTIKHLDLSKKTISMCGPAFLKNDVIKILKKDVKKLILVFDSHHQWLDCYNLCDGKKVFYMLRINEQTFNNNKKCRYGFFNKNLPIEKHFIGLHLHVTRNSNLRNEKTYLKFYSIAKSIKQTKFINFGGGQHTYNWFELKSKLKNKKITHIIEPGQPFFVNSVSAYGKIVNIKDQKTHTVVIQNLCNTCHLTWSRNKKINFNDGGDKIKIYGPTCDTEDFIIETVGNVKKLSVGQLLKFDDINPASASFNRSFNGQPKAQIFFV